MHILISLSYKPAAYAGGRLPIEAVLDERAQ